MLSVEQFAVLRAQLEAGRPREQVLRDARLTPAAWVELQRHWLGELARASTQRSSDLAARYQAAFAGAGGGAVTASAHPAAPSPSPAPVAPPPPAVVVAPAPVVPSYLRAAAITPVSPQAPVPSYLASSPAPPPVVIHVPPAHAPAATPPHVAPPVVPAVAAAVARVPLAQRGTMAVFSSPGAGPPPSATPFVEGRAPATSKRAVEAPLSSLPSSPTPSSAERRAALTGTALASGPSEGDGVALPFGKTPGKDGGAAVPLPEGVPAMSLEQYAWLSATLKRTPPHEIDAVLDRVRLTVRTRESLEAYWRARFDAEPALRQAFMPLFARFVAQGSG